MSAVNPVKNGSHKRFAVTARLENARLDDNVLRPERFCADNPCHWNPGAALRCIPQGATGLGGRDRPFRRGIDAHRPGGAGMGNEAACIKRRVFNLPGPQLGAHSAVKAGECGKAIASGLPGLPAGLTVPVMIRRRCANRHGRHMLRHGQRAACGKSPPASPSSSLAASSLALCAMTRAVMSSGSASPDRTASSL